MLKKNYNAFDFTHKQIVKSLTYNLGGGPLKWGPLCICTLCTFLRPPLKYRTRPVGWPGIRGRGVRQTNKPELPLSVDVKWRSLYHSHQAKTFFGEHIFLGKTQVRSAVNTLLLYLVLQT